MRFPQCNQFLCIVQKILIFLRKLPVQPADLVVLTVRIVVALPALSKLVPGCQHRGPLRQQQKRQCVFHLPFAQLQNCPLAGRSFHAAVPARVVGISVLIFLPVCLVMLAVVGNQIRQGKAFIAGDIIDHAVLHRVAAHSPQRLMQRILVSL